MNPMGLAACLNGEVRNADDQNRSNKTSGMPAPALLEGLKLALN